MLINLKKQAHGMNILKEKDEKNNTSRITTIHKFSFFPLQCWLKYFPCTFPTLFAFHVILILKDSLTSAGF